MYTHPKDVREIIKTDDDTLARVAPAVYLRELARSFLAVVGLRGRRRNYLKALVFQQIYGNLRTFPP